MAGVGYGAEKDQQAKFRSEVEVVAKSLQGRGHGRPSPRSTPTVRRACSSRTRTRAASPSSRRSWASIPALGSANTQIGVQGQRPSLYDLLDKMRAMTVPTLILTGDEDWPCLAPSVLMKREIPSAALAVMPNCGHTINLEDPDLFNRIVGDFIVQVEAGRWPKRDPRATSASITGMR